MYDDNICIPMQFRINIMFENRLIYVCVCVCVYYVCVYVCVCVSACVCECVCIFLPVATYAVQS